MASLLSSHLEQIALCSQSIAELSFPERKPFTNALLSPNHDITALIRDTEPHERALFQLAQPAVISKTSDISSTAGTSRRQTVHPAQRAPRSRAVAAVLGGELYLKTRQAAQSTGRQKGEIDVEVLLEGAEKLASVYPIPGAHEKITALRQRHSQLVANIAHYEDRVSRNTRELQFVARSGSRNGFAEDEAAEDLPSEDGKNAAGLVVVTKEDLEREEEEIKDLERKKRSLEERVTGMERDLGGLMS